MNGNTQFGVATPNGQVNIDNWLDAVNGAADAWTAGVRSGFAVAPTAASGMSLNIGGSAGVNDVAILKNAAGDSTTVGGHASTPFTLILSGAPQTSGQSQISSIVVYWDVTVVSAVQNGVDAVGVTYVQGAASTAPSAPTDSQIRAAIPNGATMFYAVIANVTLAYGATAIAPSAITPVKAKALSAVAASNVDWTTLAANSINVAGINWGAGLSAPVIRAGNVALPTVNSLAEGTISVSFSVAMPNTNYAVLITTAGSSYGNRMYGSIGKYTDHFTFNQFNSSSSAVAASSANWLAVGFM